MGDDVMVPIVVYYTNYILIYYVIITLLIIIDVETTFRNKFLRISESLEQAFLGFLEFLDYWKITPPKLMEYWCLRRSGSMANHSKSCPKSRKS